MSNLSSSPGPDQPPRAGLLLPPWEVAALRQLIAAACDFDANPDDRHAAAQQLAGWLANTLADYDAEQSAPDR